MYYNDTVKAPVNTGNNPLPTVDTSHVKLDITAFNVPSSASSGNNITVSWTVINDGSRVSANLWYDDLYISPDSVMDGSAVLLNYQTHSGSVAPGLNYYVSRNFTIPNGISGVYYLLLVVDATHVNTTDSFPQLEFQRSQINIALTPPPVLTVESFVAPPAVIAGQQVILPYTVTNKGTGVTDFQSGRTMFISVQLLTCNREPMSG